MKHPSVIRAIMIGLFTSVLLMCTDKSLFAKDGQIILHCGSISSQKCVFDIDCGIQCGSCILRRHIIANFITEGSDDCEGQCLYWWEIPDNTQPCADLWFCVNTTTVCHVVERICEQDVYDQETETSFMHGFTQTPTSCTQ